MAIVIDFRRPPGPGRQKPAGGGLAEILFFTGVRYERDRPAAGDALKDGKRARSAHPRETGRQSRPMSRPRRSS